ncbi:hypothetical protein CRG98_020147 [Punica granatum]|uniref:Uncharacterized protein n=1 Tax=Punica granatum TaxID=22663 RepID=A0A2I0JT13_PUNGR|nr:hypothetical protein CRG98_020147 [Punica granatum]
MREAYATRLGSVHLLGDARRTHLRRSRHLPFYDPKVEGWQVTRVSGYESCARLARFDIVKSMNRSSWAKNPKDE